MFARVVTVSQTCDSAHIVKFIFIDPVEEEVAGQNRILNKLVAVLFGDDQPPIKYSLIIRHIDI